MLTLKEGPKLSPSLHNTAALFALASGLVVSRVTTHKEIPKYALNIKT